MTPEQIRATRPLIRLLWDRRDENDPPTGRALLSWVGERGGGTCQWCVQPTASKRIKWHSECAVQYLMTKGVVRHMGGLKPLVKYTSCQHCGGEASEIDHRIPLGLARLMDYRVWIRAWHVSNLQWLCRPCHKRKTKTDKQAIAKRKRILAGSVDQCGRQEKIDV